MKHLCVNGYDMAYIELVRDRIFSACTVRWVIFGSGRRCWGRCRAAIASFRLV